ncbi:type I restriction-modification system subunit M [Halanaerobium sp.]|uniref:type I restriction-modification system subunit M n=1 Tax=Halanaerobium sp. TaxID=1895664 RepID=UPI000DE6349F|nr:type I restriction-modification system subunit M [Halanaerobium sp.]PUU90490.1 MAG: type I restriction-modification system, M subunit [Halanaerobium sp.]
MAIKKSELYSKLWKSCDELRGGMDASQYKDYILVLLFMRYVTDKYKNSKNPLIIAPEGGSFDDLVKIKGDPEIGDKTNTIIRKMAEENDLTGVITNADFNDSDKLGKGKEMVDRLTNLIAIFEDENLDFGGNSAEGDDILGDAYEYLMKHFATQSGKSKGQFYTPAEVSRVMSKIIGITRATRQDETIYDPTCGSGSLLLKASDESQKGMSIYGQEKDVSTVALAKMNMILHNNETAEIVQGDTITSPEFKDKEGKLQRFDYAVANPPFSTKSWSNGIDPLNDEFERFDGIGVPPGKNGDYAFFLHLVKSLKSNGKGAIILPHGVLFRGNAEGEIRKNVVKRGYIKGIIGLPANLFFGTGIPACIIVVDKENAQSRKGIFMIDASKGYVKDGNKNRLREQDVKKIVETFNKQLELEKYSRMVAFEEIEGNEYNLNIPRYIDNQEEEDVQNIKAHLKGGIPNEDLKELEKYWKVYPSLKEELFTQVDNLDYAMLNVGIDEIKETIYNNKDFINYEKEVKDILDNWTGSNKDLLCGIDEDTRPVELIKDISHQLLEAFEGRVIIDKYDIYQYLMAYWNDTMKDDVYMVVENGWIGDEDLLPEELIINGYFKGEKEEVENLESEKDNLESELQEFEEEHTGEDGLLEEVRNDKGNITKTALKKKVKELEKEKDSEEELEVFNKYLTLTDDISSIKKKIKKKEKALSKKVGEKLENISEDEVKDIVVEKKWIRTVKSKVLEEMERISYRLTSRIKELAERYEEPLPEIEKEVQKLEGKVKEHLKRMGVSW